MPRLYSYVVEHDQGFAPNPFMGICTLANCKPIIRKTAQVGDLIIGTGSAGIRATNHLVYWMRVSEITSFDEYWHDARFSRKKPIMNGSKMQRYGDNIYWKRDDGSYGQCDSFHSENDGSLSVSNRKRDTGTTSKVLIGNDFAYFGKSAPMIPQNLHFVVKKGQSHKCLFAEQKRITFENWLSSLPERGFINEPGRW